MSSDQVNDGSCSGAVPGGESSVGDQTAAEINAATETRTPEQIIADQVRQRAADITATTTEYHPLDQIFVKNCLDANERGDGVMYATLNRGRFLYNTTPKDGEWYAWNGTIWEPDANKRSLAAVELCAAEYQLKGDILRTEIKEHVITKDHKDSWKIKLSEKYTKRVDRLHTANGASKVLTWAPVVEPAMFCRESDFDKHPMLLPCANGVIYMTTGQLTRGRPDDMLTKAIDIDYDPRADYTPWQEFVDEITGDPETSAFLKRSFGCAVTGHAHEQYIWVFIGPGRNGKGVMFSLIGSVMGPYYHEINRGFLLEQRSEPSPGAASEHKYSLLGKRIVVGAETNRGQKIDAAAVKGLTGEDKITCRPNFKSEISFDPTHNLFLHTNHLPHGLVQDFALVQRLLLIELPFMYVDDVDAERRKSPRLADSFRQKDPLLKQKLRGCRQGILTWLMEGTREYLEHGIAPPLSVLKRVSDLQKQQDYIGQFADDCLNRHDDDHNLPPTKRTRISCTTMYDAFRWWWSVNNGTTDSGQKIPAMKTVNTALRERGVDVDKSGGKTWIYGHTIKLDIVEEVDDYIRSFAGRGGKS